MQQVNKGLPAGPDRAATHSGRALPDSVASVGGGSGEGSVEAEGSTRHTAKKATAAASKQAKAMFRDSTLQLRHTANGIVDQAATDVGQQLSETAAAVRDSLTPLRERQPKLASLADQSINKLERLASGVEHQDLESAVANTTEFARRRPELFIAGAALAGIVAGRFIQLAIEPE